MLYTKCGEERGKCACEYFVDLVCQCYGPIVGDDGRVVFFCGVVCWCYVSIL